MSPHPLVQARHRVAGVSVDTLLDQVEHDAPYVMAFCDGGYTTNMPIQDVTGVDLSGLASLSEPGSALSGRQDPGHGCL